MPLDTAQIDLLSRAVREYEFPAVYYDFDAQAEVAARGMAQVEAYIGALLRDRHPERTKHGLANVVYWGRAQRGYRDYRFNRFLANVTDTHISAFQACVDDENTPSPQDISRIRLPELRHLSFVSKVLMFLSPKTHCVLDLQIARLGREGTGRCLHNLRVYQTYIPITQHNQTVYAAWRAECGDISRRYFAGAYRPVDIERGFFALIQQSNLAAAQKIYLAA